MQILYIFDMGGVVAQRTNVISQIAEYLGISSEDVRAWIRDYAMPLMEGEMSEQEFWPIFSRRSGIPVKEELFGKFFDPVIDQAVIEIIQKIKQEARVVCGTNTISPHYKRHVERGDYEIFDAVYASHLIGIAKPRSEFFLHIFAQEGISPESTIFIDDSEENIAVARQLGVAALHFESADILLHQLIGNGILHDGSPRMAAVV